jgi:DNA-binding CsgD family transcriptional regulator
VLALAQLDLALGRWDEALERLESLSVRRRGVGYAFTSIFAIPDLIEAAVRSGRSNRGAEPLDLLARWSTSSGAAWSRPLVARCRALLASEASRGQHFEAALKLHAAVPGRAYDRARTHLAYGEHLRRARMRADARGHLRAALHVFEGVGAAPWAERARAELRASGETVRRGDPASSASLTPQELQIARIVAEGLSNRDVAAQLFLSPRTVEYHLRKVFAKLGVRSRTELARVVREMEDPGRDPAEPPGAPTVA